MPRRIVTRLLALLVLGSFLPAPASTALAQSNIQVQVNQVALDFPNDLTFELEVQSSSPIEKITLEYGTNGRTCVRGSARQPIEAPAEKTVTASWEWDFKDSGNLPPGAEVWWQWNITDQAGNNLVTEVTTLTVEDNRLDWNTVENEQVSIVWSEGARSFGLELLDISSQSLDRLETSAGIRPPGKVRLTIFPSFETLRAAGLFLPEWTGGVAFPEYSTTMIGLPINSSETWLNEVIPHELAHLVTSTLVFNCLGVGMPTWLSEGFSVYAEGEASSKNVQEMLDVLESDALPPLRNLTAGFSANSDEAVLSYTQSGEVVRFMIDNYGSEKISALLAALQSGKTIDPALNQVYGLNTDGLDNAWRTSLGFEGVLPDQAATPTRPAQRTAVPTLALWTPAFGQSSQGPDATPTPGSVAEGLAPTETPCDSSAPCTSPEVSLASPAAPSIGELAATAAPSAPPQPSSPLSCLGVNLLVGFTLASIYFLPHLARRFYN